MEPAGLKPPIVLGHENAGLGARRRHRRDDRRAGDAVLVYPPYSCGLCVDCRRGLDMHCDRHQFYGLTRGRRLRRLRARRRALARTPAGGVEPAAVAPHADAGLTAIHAVKRLASLPDAGNDLGGDRRRRRRPHRTAAPEGARRRLGRSRSTTTSAGGSSRASSAPTRCSTHDTTDAVRELTNGAGADVIIDFVATDATHAAGLDDARAGRHLLDVGYGGRSPSRRWRWSSASPRSPATWSELDRPLGAAPAARARGRRAAHRDAPARGRERRAGQAARGRRHRPRRVDS